MAEWLHARDSSSAESSKPSRRRLGAGYRRSICAACTTCSSRARETRVLIRVFPSVVDGAPSAPSPASDQRAPSRRRTGPLATPVLQGFLWS
jgi:hypothetical protein